jgi:hypothetical protein
MSALRRGRYRTAMLLFAMGLAACGPDFGPATPTGHAVRSGTVTSAVDGSPIEGASVYWGLTGWAVGSTKHDIAVTDAAGFYHLDTEHYCRSTLRAQADGYFVNGDLGPSLRCPEPGPVVVDIVLSPREPDGGGL